MKPLLKHLKYLSILTSLCFGQATFASVEEGLAWTQQGEWWEAEPLFLEEAEKGNPEAMFWLAKTQMRMGGERIFTLGRWMEESAEQGNPWAMIELVDGPNTYCSFFMLPCDDKWFDKAIEKWQQLAANGDGKAMYMLAKHKDTWRKYVPYLAHRTRVAQYEQALEMGANRAAIALYNELSRHQDIKDPAIREQAIGYLKIAAERGYAPAMVELSSLYQSDKDKSLLYLKTALSLGYPEAASVLAGNYYLKDNRTKSEWEEFYKYAKILFELGDSFYDYQLKGNYFKSALPTETIAELDQEIEDFLTKVKPNRFYDETNLY
ncbi:hypothetical protein Q4519_20740 [Motilimonas sp. 1_MG-2023]|uniref:hypothetical protein n=1 Tax=Motilimonas sp. 1_MG-2023 TaxID=3062672 RepID=UPI0026E1273B|nr:hypothetical protein [Motilimonas sp. 1_MG-2023]MDO6528103.1 hypothetical protein [Motilimonas sp. 1_MG-2023]